MRGPLFASLFASVSLVLGAPGASAEAPDVVASIHPVHSLVAAVMAGVGEPTRLLPPGASPHSYALKPSEAMKLSRADVIFRVDPTLEVFLNQPLESLPKDARVITLAAVPGTTLLATRVGGAWEEDHDHDHDHAADHAHEGGHAHEEEHGDHDHEQGRDHEEDHEHGPVDAHLWLDPRNGGVWAGAIADALSQVDPDHAEAYAANARRAQDRLAALEESLATQLAPVRGTPYLVFHDAYQYFEHRFGLNAVGAITVSPDRAPGARRVAELRDLVRDSGAACVFSEPQFEPRLVSVVIEDTGARAAVLDPLGAQLEAGPDLYPTLLQNLADSLTGCLSRS